MVGSFFKSFTMHFELKNDRKFILVKGTSELITNQNMTKAKALKFLSQNTEFRKNLFSKLPDNIDDLLKPKPKKTK